MAVTLCELLWLVDNRGELEAHKTNCRNWLSMFHKPTSLLPWTDARTSPGKKKMKELKMQIFDQKRQFESMHGE